MKKGNKLIGTLLFSLAMILPSCGGTQDDFKGTYIDFGFLKAGIGTEASEKIAEAYHTEHPDYKVKLHASIDINNIAKNSFESGKNIYDIYSLRQNNVITQYYIKGYLLDLKDVVYNAEIADGKTLLELCDESVIEYSKYSTERDGVVEDHFVSVPEFVNVNGYVYNKKLFAQHGWKVPNTTEEMKALCLQIAAAGISPIVFCSPNSADGYVYYLLNGINTQYEGIQNMKDAYKFESAEIFNPSNRTGKLHALQTFKDLYKESNGLVYPNSINIDAQEAQKALLLGRAAMMVNGSWFETEMRKFIDPSKHELAMFKVPEYSEDGEILHAPGYTNDGKGIIDSEYTAEYVIPTLAPHKEAAIDFLKFMQRPDICELYTKYSNNIRPFKYNKNPESSVYSNMSSFGKTILQLANENTLFVASSKHPKYILGEISYWPSGDSDRYHTNRLLRQDKEPIDCLEVEYNNAKKVLG